MPACLLASCATSTPYVTRPSTPTATPWVVPSSELHSQRLFRARLESPEGRGRFRLALRLESEQRYRLDSTHPLFNRRLWSFEARGDEGLLVDYIQKVTCRTVGEVEISALPLGPFLPAHLPALLLGFLPLAPQAAEGGAGSRWEMVDEEGRRWTAEGGPAGIVSWALWDGDETAARWSTSEEWAILEAPRDDIRVRWRETVREPLGAPPSALEAPRDFEEGVCDLGWIRDVEGTWDDEALD